METSSNSILQLLQLIEEEEDLSKIKYYTRLINEASLEVKLKWIIDNPINEFESINYSDIRKLLLSIIFPNENE